MINVTLIIAFLALLAAAITDIRKREVPDWLSYSLIAVAIVIALSKSVISDNYVFILGSVLGLAVFFILANLFYYGRLFAGGDAKLLIGMGALLGIDFAFLLNTLIIGGIYGLVYSAVLALINFKEVKKEIRKIKINFIIFILIALVSLVLALFFNPVIFCFIAFLAVAFPLLYASTLAVERASLIKIVSPDKLTEGDWLTENVRIGKKLIKASFEGLTKEEIKIIQKANKKVRIKYGLPFVPVFLIAFVLELIVGNLFFLLI